MQGHVDDKMLAALNGLPVICYSVRAFISSGCVQQFTIVYRDASQKAALEQALQLIELNELSFTWVQGGARRQDSVYKALQHQPKECSHVFIHDGARPLLSSDAIQMLHVAVLKDKAATLARPVTDTIKRIPGSEDLAPANLEDLDRSRLWAIETPQAFERTLILKAHEKIQNENLTITDDTAAISTLGMGVTLVPNNSANIKITQPEDLDYASWLLAKR